jgi:tRNA-Thr(GGU) m(6)t(6)A37 methyltransferase TsaA
MTRTMTGPITLEPIGRVSSAYHRRFGTPQQASAVDSDASAVLILDPARIPPEALADLAGFDRIWILSWLHRGDGWSPQVFPPRGPRQRRGVLATRSPDRPNPIGLSAAVLVAIDGCDLHVRGIDLLDGTPILDIKPYVPYADAFPGSRAGWIDAIPPSELQRVKRPPTGEG